jgi:predicted Zn-dependent protease
MKPLDFSLQQWLAILAGVLILVLTSCYTIPQTGRSAFNIVGAANELRLGQQAFQDIKKKEPESRDAKEVERVQRVGKRIAEVADQDIPNARWEFVLFDNKEPNAFALPGGKVGIYTGILKITQDDAGLAAVMGHEIAHVAVHHSTERMSHQLVAAGLATSLAIGLNQEDHKTQEIALVSFGLVTTFGVILPYSRMHESEADRIGLTYMAKAGYPPRAAVDFWRRFREYNLKKGGNPPAFFSTHPADEKRIADLQALLPEAEVYYKTSGRGQ